jgi:hypothetical protein
MSEKDEIVAENENVQAENVEEAPTSEEQVENSQAGEAQPEAEAEEQVEEVKEVKPTRSERRIKALLDERNKALEEAKALKEELLDGREDKLPWESQDAALFNPDETELDPQEFQTRIDKYIDQKVDEKVRQREAYVKEVETYQKTYEDHAKDLEDVLQKHPEFDSENGGSALLESKFIELFNKLNTEMRNGKEVYIPKVKASEVAKTLLDIKEGIVTKETSEITGKTIKQQMEGALQPSSSDEDVDYQADDLYESARSSGKTETWAEYLKKLGMGKGIQS